MNRIGLLALAIVLLGGAVMVGIYLATEPDARDARSARNGILPPALAAADPQAAVSLVPPAIPPELPRLAGPAETPPPEWRKEHPTIPAPVPNEAAPIAAKPPRGLPAEPARREDAILDVRRKRFADQMDRLNRRNAQRGGIPSDAGARPPRDPPRPGSRGAALSSGQ